VSAPALRGNWQFVWAGLTRQRQTGGFMPSGRFLVSKMISAIPESYDGQVLELGAGTGALTLRLAARCRRARILSWEIQPQLAREVRSNVAVAGLEGRVEVIEDSALGLLAEMRRRGLGQADYVVSGVPLANLGLRAEVLLDTIHGALAEGGTYVQFQHSTTHQRRIRDRFRRLRTVPVLLNFPPAVVYYASK